MRAKAVAGDIILILTGIIAGGGLGYFLRAGLRSGVMETRNGNFDSATQPIRFWTAAFGFVIGILFCIAALFFAISDLLFGFRT